MADGLPSPAGAPHLLYDTQLRHVDWPGLPIRAVSSSERVRRSPAIPHVHGQADHRDANGVRPHAPKAGPRPRRPKPGECRGPYATTGDCSDGLLGT